MITGSEEYYKKKVVNALKDEFKYSSVMAVPKISKIVLNMGVGEGKVNKTAVTNAINDLSIISGQKAVATKAKKSIAQFKIRQGMEIGARVTLRGKKMYNFLCKLIHISLPRVRDFNGIPRKAFDGRGNYTIGIKEHIIFPEIDMEKIENINGLNVTIVTTAKDDDSSRKLLELMGFPFRKK